MLFSMNETHGAPSYSLKSDLVSLHISIEGGQLSPVEFTLGQRTVSPYSLSPWKPRELDQSLPPLIKNLRGDFFCLPFGPQENGLPHGETANNHWEKIAETPDSIILAIEPSDVSAKVTKTIALKPSQTALYVSHTIEGLDGDWSYGNHPILDFSGQPDESVRISVSPFRWASVYPEWFSNPADGANQALEIAALFTDLSEVPLANGGTTDLTRYPARPATDDLVMMVSEAPTAEQPFAWSACVLDGYVWFALKNPNDFPATLFWISNGGRSAAPWNSRHTTRIGIEEVCSYFCDSVDISRKDLLRNLSIPTSRRFSQDEIVTLKFIQAVAAAPSGFGLISSIVPDGQNHVTITDENGTAIRAAVDWKEL